MEKAHKIIALHPDTGEMIPAILKEDWFGKGKDAVNFGGGNSPNWRAEDIQWEFAQ